MTLKQLGFKAPPSLAIAEGATTPNPGLPGVSCWSTTLGARVTWTGSLWTAGATSPFGPPTAPTLSGPISAAQSSGGNFYVGAYAHPNGVPMYGLQIRRATDSGFTTGLELSSITHSTALTKTMGATTVGVLMYWQARFIDELGGISAWSSTGTYTGFSGQTLIGVAHAGSNSQVQQTVSVAGAQAGDLYVLAMLSSTGTPAGFTLRATYASGDVGGYVMTLYTKVVASAGESVVSTGYEQILACVRGVTDYVSLANTTLGSGITSATLALSTGAEGNANLIIGIGYNQSTHTLPAAWTRSYGVPGDAANGYFLPVLGFSASAVAGGTVSRATGANATTVAAIRLI